MYITIVYERHAANLSILSGYWLFIASAHARSGKLAERHRAMTWCPAVAMSGLGLEYRGAEGSQLTVDREDTALDSLLTAMPGCLPAESYAPR